MRFDRLDMFKVVHPTLKRCQYGKLFNLYPKQFRPIRSFMILYGYIYIMSVFGVQLAGVIPETRPVCDLELRVGDVHPAYH